METEENVKVVTVMGRGNGANVPTDLPPVPLPDVTEVFENYGKSVEILGEYEIPGEQVEEVDENGVTRVTTTSKVLVRVSEIETEEEIVTLRQVKPNQISTEIPDYRQLERERRKLIAGQRRSTPDIILENLWNFPNQEMNSVDEDKEPGEVDYQSILDNKDNTKKFLTNKMLETTQNSNDSKAPLKRVAPAKAEEKNHVVVAPVLTNGNGNIFAVEVPMVKEKVEPMHLVEARPCFIEQTSVLPTVNGIKKDESISTQITKSKIAQEIEECRLREEELKLQRIERFGKVENNEDGSGIESEIVPTNGSIIESVPVEMESPRLTYSLPLFVTPQDIQKSQDTINRLPDATQDLSQQRNVKVRPLRDDSDDEDKPTYMVYKESAVEREIRIAREREEELRKEKNQRLISGNSALLVAQTEPNPVIPKEPAPLDIVFLSPESKEPELDKIFLPEPKVVQTIVDATKDPVQNGHVSLIQKRAPSKNLTITQPNEVMAARVNQQNLASARLHQEVNEVIQKELALKESGSIVTTSQDRIDEKVINIRQYKVDAAVNNTFVPQSAPPALNPATNFGREAFNLNGGNGPRINGTANRPALYRSATTRGLMARFIASKGKVTALPVFVPKVSKPPLEVIAEPTPTLTPMLDIHASLTHTQEMNVRDDTVSMSDFDQSKPTPERMAYRRNYSMVENKILHELRDMKAREEELRKLRMNISGISTGSLESLLDSEDSGEANGHADTPNGSDGIFSFAKDYDSDISLENQTYNQGTLRKRSYLINQWEERIQQNE